MSVESLRGGHAVFGDVLPHKHFPDGQEENLCIQRERQMVHVPDIQLEFPLPGDVVAPVHLRPSRDARPHLVPPELLLGIQGQILGQQRTWTNQGHVSLQDIEQLGQFIDGQGADYPSHLRQTRLVRQQIAFRIPLVRHRLELDGLEDAGIFTRPVLGEKYAGTFVGEMKEDDEEQEDGPNEEEGGEDDDKVYQSFKNMSIHKMKHS